jgi:hypothetical protein
VVPAGSDPVLGAAGAAGRSRPSHPSRARPAMALGAVGSVQAPPSADVGADVGAEGRRRHGS